MSPRTLQSVLGICLLATTGVAFGQIGSPALGGNPMGESSVTDRYQKARHGANMGEWIRRLADEDPLVRLDAVKSMGESGEVEAVDYLMQAVGDPDERVRAKAVDYLGEMRATGATFFLIQRLFMSGTSPGLRHRVLMALGKIGDAKASRPIVEFLSRDVPPDVRGTGIYALGEIGDPSIEQDLRHMLETEDNPRLARLIHEALAKIGQRRADAPKSRGGAFPSALEAALRPPDQPPQ